MEVVDENTHSEVELDESDVTMLEQLQKIAQITNKTDELETVDFQLKRELEMLQTEQQRVREYKRELELLNQERIAHVEELRLIHADINLLETTIKTAEEAERRVAEEARRLLARGSAIRDGVDTMKSDLRMHSDSPSQSPAPPVGLGLENCDRGHPGNINRSDRQAAEILEEAQRFALQAVATSFAGVPNSSFPISAPSMRSMEPVSQSQQHSSQHGSSGSGGGSIFRQQPPPMKMCLSCHQQIHRNAPICPLCKAKSRSRNPKKPKRKVHDE